MVWREGFLLIFSRDAYYVDSRVVHLASRLSRPFLTLLVLFLSASCVMPLTSEPSYITFYYHIVVLCKSRVTRARWLFASFLLSRFLALAKRNSKMYPFFSNLLTSMFNEVQSYDCGHFEICAIYLYYIMILALSFSLAAWFSGLSTS